MNYNRIILIGRLTRDPELRTTPDGVELVRCTVAVNRRSGGEEVADFFDFVAFRQQADFLANYATKGRLVLVEGRLQSRSYTDREGIRRKAYEVVADTVRLLDRPREEEVTPAAGAPEAGFEAAESGDAARPVSAAAVAPAQGAAARRPAPATQPEPEEEIEIPEELLDEDFEVESDPFAEMP